MKSWRPPYPGPRARLFQRLGFVGRRGASGEPRMAPEGGSEALAVRAGWPAAVT